ncbi:MAG: YXWGXW repeat-containing protein [Rhodanobacteraceae bacterium]
MQTSKLALVIALAFAGGAAVSVTPPASAAQVGLSITVGSPPPPMRRERIPPPRPGYVWAPGYWNWSGSNYIWVVGTWQRARPGYVYARPHWVHRGNRWVYHPSRWTRDPHWHGHGHHY